VKRRRLCAALKRLGYSVVVSEREWNGSRWETFYTGKFGDQLLSNAGGLHSEAVESCEEHHRVTPGGDRGT
jgi:hypothetical protein